MFQGKGLMNTYWLIGKENGVCSASEIEFTDDGTFIPEFLQMVVTPTIEDDLQFELSVSDTIDK